MNSFNLPTPLTEVQIEKIKRATETILERTGFTVEDADLLKKAHACGAKVDDVSGRVRIPTPLLRELLAQVPATYTIRGILGDQWEVGSKQQHGLAIVTDPWIIDYQTQQPRHPNLEDIRRHTIIAQQIDPVAAISCMDYPVTDCPDATSSLRALEAHLLLHAKHYHVMAATTESFKQWLAIARILAKGGDIRGLISAGIAVVSPLMLNSLNCGLLVRAVEEGFAVVPTVCPMAGSTSPYSIAGTLLQANVEALMVAVMAQVIRPGAPFLYIVGPSVTDMHSGHDLYYTLDKVLWKTAASQMGRSYHLPTSAECGGTLTHRDDQQSGAEGMLFMLAAHASKAHMLAGFGSCYNANGMSAEMMLIQREYLKAARFLARGIHTDDFRLGVGNIESAGPGGNFLTDELTVSLLRQDEFFQSDLFDFSGGRHEAKSLLENAHERVEEMVAGFQSPVPGDVQEDLRRCFYDRYVSIK
ncbi:MAG: trimethylamine methyltransferase family protein [Verrucomicrobia bacterium]|nr:trimethylamine methyltransferase family protein [Verrucomicrobiota bacterium]